jgi:hypothetical protein
MKILNLLLISFLLFLSISFIKIILLKKEYQLESNIILKNYFKEIQNFFTKKRSVLIISVLLLYLVIDKIIITIVIIFSEDITPYIYNYHFLNNNPSSLEHFKYEICLFLCFIFTIIKVINKKNILLKISIIFYILTYYLVQSMTFKIIGTTDYDTVYPVSYIITTCLFQSVQNVNKVLLHILWYINIILFIFSIILIQNYITNKIIAKINIKKEFLK